MRRTCAHGHDWRMHVHGHTARLNVSPVRAREAALPRMLVCMRVLCLHVFVTV